MVAEADVVRQRKGSEGGDKVGRKRGQWMSGSLRVWERNITRTHIYVIGSPGTKRAHNLNMWGTLLLVTAHRHPALLPHTPPHLASAAMRMSEGTFVGMSSPKDFTNSARSVSGTVLKTSMVGCSVGRSCRNAVTLDGGEPMHTSTASTAWHWATKTSPWMRDA